MANLGSMLKEEISRLARRQITRELSQVRKHSAQHRRDIASLKRQLGELQRRLSYVERQERKRGSAKAAEAPPPGARFSPKWLKSHRAKLGISAADYAALVGVSPLTVYNWEHGKSKPRAKQLAALVEVRKLGKRDAQRQLEQKAA